jgi:hypothetical protein
MIRVAASGMAGEQPANHPENPAIHMARDMTLSRTIGTIWPPPNFAQLCNLGSNTVLRARFPLAVALFELHMPRKRREFERVGRASRRPSKCSLLSGPPT